MLPMNKFLKLRVTIQKMSYYRFTNALMVIMGNKKKVKDIGMSEDVGKQRYNPRKHFKAFVWRKI